MPYKTVNNGSGSGDGASVDSSAGLTASVVGFQVDVKDIRLLSTALTIRFVKVFQILLLPTHHSPVYRKYSHQCVLAYDDRQSREKDTQRLDAECHCGRTRARQTKGDQSREQRGR